VIEKDDQDINSEVIDQKLKTIGFKDLKIKKTRVTNIPTNSIWVGSKVDIKDVKLLAYTLIRAGVEIKGIRKFKEVTDSSERALLIQVGGADDVLNRQPYTVEEINKASHFEDRDLK
jgi:hypothetical protein